MNVDDLLREARKIWGDERLSLEEVAIRLGVVTGDIHRLARTHQESGHIDTAALQKEMGNLIFSTIRWCDDLGLDTTECLRAAQQAQRDYAKKLPR